MTKALISVAGFVIANFIYQFFTTKDWGVAFERSYFQAIAILTYTYLVTLK